MVANWGAEGEARKLLYKRRAWPLTACLPYRLWKMA